MKKTGVTLERHKEIGNMLKNMRENLVLLNIELYCAYKRTDKNAVIAQRAISKALNGVDNAKNYLENQLLNVDNRELLSQNREEALNIYYGTVNKVQP